METIECKYRLPCGWCERTQEKCIFDQVCVKQCSHHWVWDTKQLAYKCTICGEKRYRGYKD